MVPARRTEADGRVVPAHNSFDLIRLLLAGMVAVVHVAILSDEPGLAWIPRVISSDLAVKAFFVVSGFLIVMSYERSSSWRSYADKRARRIYPAYAVVILLSAALLAMASRAPAGEYFSRTWLRYVGANLLFLNFVQPTLPGVFEANHLPTVNGALWTLKIEVAFYATVPLLVFLCRRFGWRVVLAVTYAGSLAYAKTLTDLAAAGGPPIYEALAHQLPGQLSYFAVGTALYYLLPTFRRHVAAFALPALVVLVVDQVYPLAPLEPAALGIAVVTAGLSRYGANFGRRGDFSYGLYILHFPVIQILVQTGWMRGQPTSLLVTALAASLSGAVVLWHTVEKRWLLRESHYRLGASGTSGTSGPTTAAEIVVA